MGLNSNDAEPKYSGKNRGRLAISPVKNTVHHNRTGFFLIFVPTILQK
jgi:hypothetical protein